MNWSIIIPVGIAVIALIVYLVIRNQKDEKQFEQQIKNDYPKAKDEEGDAEIDEVLK
ncbi:MAG: hypothetical protein IPK31_20180 [Chitinophagaceae bacterium]|nr:hypothetical protein [Chitinophagaceae bacterium]